MECFKCGLELKENEAVDGYGSRFHKKCLKEFSKQSKKEVEKVLKHIL